MNAEERFQRRLEREAARQRELKGLLAKMSEVGNVNDFLAIMRSGATILLRDMEAEERENARN